MIAPTNRPSPLLVATLVAALAGLGVAVVGALRTDAALRELAAKQAENGKVLQDVLGEVTRTRIEQSAGKAGPQALLEKLRTFAPLASNARTTEPDYKNARKEMDAIQRAFHSLGADALPAIRARLDELKDGKKVDEIKELVKAIVGIDKTAGVALLKTMLLDTKTPAPRLRWFAADELLEHDRPLAQGLLRQILLTESAKGLNPDRAAPGTAITDPVALASQGFSNFVQRYVDSGDPKTDETLIMVIGRAEHDAPTVQACVRALGDRRSEGAVEAIERAYAKPPLGVENALFLNICLDALFDIRHADSKPFLEAALANANNELVGTHIQYLLTRIANNDFDPPKKT